MPWIDLDVEDREPAQRREARHAHHGEDEADQRAADEGREGQRHRPAQRRGEVEEVDRRRTAGSSQLERQR